MAERKLTVKIIGDNRSLTRELRSSTRQLDTFGRSSSRALKQFTAGAGLGVATAGFAALGLAARQGFQEMLEASKATAQTEAAIKSTGGVAGVTADQVDRLSQALMRKTGIDDEAIKSSQNLLLTFTNVRNVAGQGNDIFNRASEAILDMSVRMGTDATSSAIQLGKALQDPVRGMTALRRVGVSFTNAQQDQIRTLVNSGRVLDAQKLILRELNVEFGGSAEAAGKADGGIAILRETINNFLGDLATNLLPTIQDVTAQLQAWFDNEQNLTNATEDLKNAVSTAASVFREFKGAVESGNRAMDSLRSGMDRASDAVRGSITATFRRLPGTVEKAGAQARDALVGQFRRMEVDGEQAAAAIGLSFQAALAESFALKGRTPVGTAEPPGVAQAIAQRAGISIEQRNKWFDAAIGRQLNRVQDIRALQGQLRELDEIGRLIQERINKTQDITRRLALEDDLLDVRRRQRSVREQIAANREAHRAEMEALAEQRQDLLREQREREALARATRQFRALGLGPGGTELVPNAASLRKSLGSIREAVKGTVLDTSETKSQMARISRVLTGEFGKVSEDVRATMRDMLNDLKRQLDEFEGGRTIARQAFNPNRLLAGLGLDPEEVRRLRARLARIGPGGTVAPRGTGAFGFAAGAGGVTEISNFLIVDGKTIEAPVTRQQKIRRRRNPVQKRGPSITGA